MARGTLRRFVGVWLLCQSLTVAGPAVALWSSRALDCECSHGDGATCPMHKSPVGQARCAVRSTASDDGSVVMSPVESTGPVSLTIVAHMPSLSTPLALDSELALDRPFVPDLRPPRA